MSEAICEANKRSANLATKIDESGPAPKHAKKTWSSYSAEDCALIGRYSVEHHGPTKASRCFTVPESPASLLKKQYLAELNNQHQKSVKIPEVY